MNKLIPRVKEILKIKNGDKMYEEIKDKAFEHKHALIFVGGIAGAVVGKKILESDRICTFAHGYPSFANNPEGVEVIIEK